MVPPVPVWIFLNPVQMFATLTAAIVTISVFAGSCLGLEDVNLIPQPYWSLVQAGIVKPALLEAQDVNHVTSYGRMKFGYISNQGHVCRGEWEEMSSQFPQGLEGWSPVPPVKSLTLFCEKPPFAVKPTTPSFKVKTEDNSFEKELRNTLSYVARFAEKEVKGVTAQRMSTGHLKWIEQSDRENLLRRFSCTIGVKTDNVNWLQKINDCWQKKCGFQEILVKCNWNDQSPKKSEEKESNLNKKKVEQQKKACLRRQQLRISLGINLLNDLLKLCLDLNLG